MVFSLFITGFLTIASKSFSQDSKPAGISVDINDTIGPLKTIWSYFGYDEPNYTYMKDGKKLLTELAALRPSGVFVRTHNLLTSGDGSASFKWGSTNAYTEDANGNPVYDWHIVDSIFDTFIQKGLKPVAEIGFMPEALSTHPQPYRHNWKPGMPYQGVYTGWAYPPKDYNRWSALVYEWVKHCVQRYGETEVNSWWWEVWNEPNIGYWKPNQKDKLDDYLKLYDYAANAVKMACPNARIGGPTSTGPSWETAATFLENFLNHCAAGTNYATGKPGAPLDYISFHAKGSPVFIDGHVRMNMTTQLNDIEKGFAIVAASDFNHLPIIIGECDPEGCAACGMSTNPENAYRNGTMYSSYTASSFARIYDLAARYHVNIEGALSWSFEFENQKWFEGFRDLATNGIDKPVLNIFRMFGMMKGNRLKVDNANAVALDSLIKSGVHAGKHDIGSMAVADKMGTSLMIWDYYDDDIAGNPVPVEVIFNNIPSKKATLHIYAVDKEHSNTYEMWKQTGSPQQVSKEQYATLEKEGQLKQLTEKIINIPSTRRYTKRFTLPNQGVYLLQMVYER